VHDLLVRIATKGRRVPLSGSAPVHPAGTQLYPEVPDSKQVIGVTVVVRPRCSTAWIARAARRMARLPPAERRYLTHDEFTQTCGAAPADLDRVAAFGRKFGLRIAERSADRWCVVLTGSIEQMATAFAVTFARCEHADTGAYRTHLDAVNLPVGIAHIVVAVIGLDSRPLVRLPQRVYRTHRRTRKAVAPHVLAKFYEFPRATSGRGQAIGLIELGGGFTRADVKSSLRGRLPKITVVSVDGHRNARYAPSAFRRDWKLLCQPPGQLAPAVVARLGRNANRLLSIVEATMDIELAAALAPDAHLVVYFAPATFHGKYHAFTKAIADGRNNPGVVSCSFGLLENQVTQGYARAVNFALQAGTLKGITFCASTGDYGSGPEAGRPPIVQYPASDPYMLACGGTSVRLRARRERAWREITFGRVMASGGGFSRQFQRPNWAHAAQKVFRNRGRGVPDVAAKADVNGGYRIVVGGAPMTMGGTSAAAPLWAALIARLSEALGTPLGLLTPWLYDKESRPAVRNISTGSTGIYRARRRGWDPCTGFGTPRGSELLRLLRPRRNSPTDVSS
jgi:kumamolisin